MSNVPPVFDGERVALTSADPIWFLMRPTPGLQVGTVLFHLDPPSTTWTNFLSKSGALLERLALTVQTMHGDSIGWVIQCHSMPATNLPVFVQLCQGPDEQHLTPITRVARYDVVLAANEARLISDAIQIQ